MDRVDSCYDEDLNVACVHVWCGVQEACHAFACVRCVVVASDALSGSHLLDDEVVVEMVSMEGV